MKAWILGIVAVLICSSFGGLAAFTVGQQTAIRDAAKMEITAVNNELDDHILEAQKERSELAEELTTGISDLKVVVQELKTQTELLKEIVMEERRRNR
jgi:hypothetical protein